MFGVGVGIYENHVFYRLLPVVSAPYTTASRAIMLALSRTPHISSSVEVSFFTIKSLSVTRVRRSMRE